MTRVVVSCIPLDIDQQVLISNQYSSECSVIFCMQIPKLHGSKEQAVQILSAQDIVVVLSEKTQMRLVSTTGQPLTFIETAGLTNHGAALSLDGRFLAAATFTADVKVPLDWTHACSFDVLVNLDQHQQLSSC